MSFLNFFRRKKEAAAPTAPKLLLPDGKLASPQLAALLPKLAPFAQPCVRITATPSEQLELTDSKFGGYPYWPESKAYPVDSYGQYMYLLAQINFDEVPHLEGYPEKGLLQFYISADDLHGFDDDHPTEQTNFRVVYFDNTTETPLKDFPFLHAQEQESSLPLSGSMQLSFTPDTDYYSVADVHFADEEAEGIVVNAEPVQGKHLLEKELSEVYPDSGHKIGGYAYFTQIDPRIDEAAYEDYILLLQIDSQGDEICWGDLGVGNFFIHRDDLKRKDFSRVLYNWDCT